MIRKLFQDTKFEKSLAALAKAGKKGEIATEKAADVMDHLATGVPLHLQTRLLTKKGEARIPGCVKFDLGSGYRMVCIQEKEDLYLLFVGTHDESDRWIENNREIRLDQITGRCRPIPVRSDTRFPFLSDASEILEEDPLDAIVLDDRILKTVFCGLIEASQ